MHAVAGAFGPALRLGRRSVALACIAILVLGLLLAGQAHARDPIPATLTADRVFMQSRDVLVAEGSVEIWQGSVRVTAQRVTYDRRRDTVALVGPITYSEGPDLIILGDEAQLSRDLRDGLIHSARMVLNQELQIAANRLERRDGRLTEMDQVIASACQVCAARPTPLWEIRARHAVHDQETQRYYFHHAHLRFAGVPVFYSPYVSAPDATLRRAPGFLAPRYSLTTTFGFGLSLPFFIPIGDDRDLTLTPILTTSGALSLGMRWRQAFRSGGLELRGQISKDDIFADIRGYANARGRFDLGGGWDLTFNLTGATDNRYLGDYAISGASRVRNDITVQRLTRDEAARLRFIHFEPLRRSDVASRQPNRVAHAEWDRIFSLAHTGLGGTLRLRASAQAQERASNLDVIGRDMSRVSASAEWRNDWVLSGGLVLGAGALAQVDHYAISQDSNFPDPVTRTALQGMVELRWPWAAQDARGNRYLIEPVAQVVASGGSRPVLPNDDNRMPEFDQGNLFAFTRYTGGDAPDLGSRANLGLRWLRDSDEGLSAELAAGRIWRLADAGDFDPLQPLGGQNSNWLLASRLGWGSSVQFTARALFHDSFEIAQGESTMSWSRNGLTLGGTYFYAQARPFENRARDLSTLDLTSSYSFDDNWRGRARIGYDLLTGNLRRASAGMNFRNECLLFDLSLSQNFSNSTNVPSTPRLEMQLELLGFGGSQMPGPARACPT